MGGLLRRILPRRIPRAAGIISVPFRRVDQFTGNGAVCLIQVFDSTADMCAYYRSMIVPSRISQ
jgi:hypothetical protein